MHALTHLISDAAVGGSFVKFSARKRESQQQTPPPPLLQRNCTNQRNTRVFLSPRRILPLPATRHTVMQQHQPPCSAVQQQSHASRAMPSRHLCPGTPSCTPLPQIPHDRRAPTPVRYLDGARHVHDPPHALGEMVYLPPAQHPRASHGVSTPATRSHGPLSFDTHPAALQPPHDLHAGARAAASRLLHRQQHSRCGAAHSRYRALACRAGAP